jgi:hypothetical protein
MPTLGVSIFCYNAISQDYCLEESVASAKALADEVILLDCGSTDQSDELCRSLEDEKTKVVCLPQSEWAALKGKEKLSHFANTCKNMLSTDWRFDLQIDEVISERSFPFIREAISKDEESFFCTRVNLWGNSQHKLNVEDGRKPVGDKIIRLAKTKYFSVDDSEGIFAPASWDFLDKIKIFHMGFVRDKHIHMKKIDHMLTKVFGMGPDPKLEEMKDGFDPWVNFSKSDVVPIGEDLPIFVQEWAKKRDEINNIII